MISEPALDRLSAMFQGPDVTGTRYQLISVLGRGGMGIVYLARDTVLEREVALKIVERPSDEANEARILARLEHPGIVPVHDFGELPDGRLFYAMKRVRGDRLDRWMATERDLDQRLGVFLRVCETVAFAHAHGVIHLDLKPENVMVGEFGEVLVLDWGVAQLRIADCGLRIQTDGAIVGTPDYMAPEQARGDAAVDHRADVFALGAMLESNREPGAGARDRAEGAVAGGGRPLSGRPGARRRRQPLPRRARGGSAPRAPRRSPRALRTPGTACRYCWCSPTSWSACCSSG